MKPLQTLETQFKNLKSSLDNLTHKFEQQAENLQNQISQDAMWASAVSLCLLSGLTSAETGLLLSYACETLVALRCLVTAAVPDLAQGLPTTAAILRHKTRHSRIRAAWDAALQRLELHEGDVAALGNVFIFINFSDSNLVFFTFHATVCIRTWEYLSLFELSSVFVVAKNGKGRGLV
uniref:Uncharacterized protein n=1 Tax=Nothoprocta perdicaria TaxID=30464 RepID=A0A8C6ZSM6_NOTPE